MPHPLAIARNRHALLAIVASIVALLGGREASGPISRALRRAVLALLRPAESAVRRLIVIAARELSQRGLSSPLQPVRPFPASLAFAAASGAGGAEGRVPAFRLFDRPKRFGRLVTVAPRGVPRIRSFGGGPFSTLAAAATPVASVPRLRPDPDAPVASGMVRLRLAALELALADLPRQARRLVRRLARGRADGPTGALRSPLRIGRPPGWRREADRAVDQVLRECDGLARDALRSDTS